MTGDLIAFDHALRSWVVLHRVTGLNGGMWVLSVIGRGGMVFLAAAAVVSVRRRSPRDVTTVAAAVLLAAVLADHVVKPWVHRVRPFRTDASVAVIGTPPHDSSFPSGHAATCFAGAESLSAIAPAAAGVWWILATAVAYSRVYLGVHYPADVIAGALIGVGCAMSVRLIARPLRGTGGTPARPPADDGS
jgi:undecaprenyl-diphosphatase